MQNRVDRAKQFFPFDALSGFRDYLNNAEYRQEYIQNHIKWFLSNHPVLIFC